MAPQDGRLELPRCATDRYYWPLCLRWRKMGQTQVKEVPRFAGIVASGGGSSDYLTADMHINARRLAEDTSRRGGGSWGGLTEERRRRLLY